MLKIILIEGRYIVVQASGKLDADDYPEFEQAIEELVAKYQIVRMLVMLKGFEGWSVSGLKEEFKFGWSHRSKFEKIAIVGEGSQEKLAWFVEVFSSTIVEFFLTEEGEQAWKWLHANENEEYYSWAVMPFVHGPDEN